MIILHDSFHIVAVDGLVKLAAKASAAIVIT